MSQPPGRPRSRLFKFTAGCGIALLLVFLVEGIASFAVFAHDVFTRSESPPAERRHTRYDGELGWVNIPGVRVEDLYAPGRTVTINAQGFRGERDVTVSVPDDRVRIVCSGDSFTFGYGVGDGDTWCAQLEELAPALEVVNMGQGGYGLDQIYLWYLRDGRQLDLDIHLVAINAHDIERMTSDVFFGYGKPTLVSEGGVLRPDRVPVPDAAFVSPWATQNVEILRKLGVVDMTARLTGSLGLETWRDVMTVEHAMDLARAAVRHMAAISREKGAAFVFVFFPAGYELTNHTMDGVRDAFTRALQAEQIPIIDLVEYFRRLPLAEARDMFIRHGEVDYPGAEGHFTQSGNWQAAQQLLFELRKIPDVASRLR